MTRPRWLYHVREAHETGSAGAGDYAPASLEREGFVHCSFRDDVGESARLYFAPSARLEVLRIDPRRLSARVEIAHTPRGPMPHVHGPIPSAAIVWVGALGELVDAPDEIEDL